MHYVGQPIVSDDSILRKLPVIVEREQRIRFNALVFAADVLSHSYSEIREVAIQVGPDINSATSRAHIELISLAWSIVDQLHAARQLWNLFPGEPGPNTREFNRVTGPATLMRNDMDHLNIKIRNLSLRKDRIAPIFGALSYFYVSETGFFRTMARRQ